LGQAPGRLLLSRLSAPRVTIPLTYDSLYRKEALNGVALLPNMELRLLIRGPCTPPLRSEHSWMSVNSPWAPALI